MSAALDLDLLIDRWRGPLVGLLAARGASWAQAEELAQDVFAEAWIHIERFRGDFEDERAFGAWLAGIARNLHRTEVRKASATEPLEDVPCESDEAEPHETLLVEDEADAVRSAIEALPEREREAVQAFYLEETPTARVAGLLETSERAVEGLLRRARARLKQALAAVAGGRA